MFENFFVTKAAVKLTSVSLASFIQASVIFCHYFPNEWLNGTYYMGGPLGLF
jgi:hypothetical protein